MSDDKDDGQGLIGWITGLAVALAIAVALLASVFGVMSGASDKPPATLPAAAIAPAVAHSGHAAEPVALAPVAAAGSPAAAKIYFDVNSFATPVDANKLVVDLVAYSKTSANTKLSISGYHDKTGDPAKNQELAKNRAKVVKDLLLSAGVPEDRIMMQKPVETTGDGDNKEARRVEVIAIQ